MLSTSPNVAPRRSSSPLMDNGPVYHRAQSTQHWWHSIVANPWIRDCHISVVDAAELPPVETAYSRGHELASNYYLDCTSVF